MDSQPEQIPKSERLSSHLPVAMQLGLGLWRHSHILEFWLSCSYAVTSTVSWCIQQPCPGVSFSQLHTHLLPIYWLLNSFFLFYFDVLWALRKGGWYRRALSLYSAFDQLLSVCINKYGMHKEASHQSWERHRSLLLGPRLPPPQVVELLATGGFVFKMKWNWCIWYMLCEFFKLLYVMEITSVGKLLLLLMGIS